MEPSDLEAIQSVLLQRRHDIEAELPALDAAISRLDVLIEDENRKDAYHHGVQSLRAEKAAL
jgi:hypothetical protein